MDNDPRWKKDGFTLRLAQAEDVDDYYAQNYCPLDKEIARLTGCKAEFTKEEVRSFFLKSLEADDRYFFLILSPDGRIVGESVINEIDWALGSKVQRTLYRRISGCGYGGRCHRGLQKG